MQQRYPRANVEERKTVTNFQSEKQIVRRFYDALDGAETAEIPAVMAEFCSDDLLWHGFHPFNEIRGAVKVGESFWQPLRHSLTHMQRRMDVFIAGRNKYDDPGGIWVCSMGHLMGLFDAPWLGIRPTGKLGFLRYCAFHRIENGVITETAMYFDIPHLMTQAGQNPFPPQTAAHLVQPGRITHDGLLFDAHPPDEGE